MLVLCGRHKDEGLLGRVPPITRLEEFHPEAVPIAESSGILLLEDLLIRPLSQIFRGPERAYMAHEQRLHAPSGWSRVHDNSPCKGASRNRRVARPSGRARLVACVLLLGLGGGPAIAQAQSPQYGVPAPRYLRACSSEPDSFFWVPGFDTCLRVGGYVRSDIAVSNTPYRVGLTNNDTEPATGVYVPVGAIAIGSGWIPNRFVPPRARDAVGWSSLARLELDSRTPTAFGTVRAFLRIELAFGAGATANGALPQSFTNGTLGTYGSSETSLLDKAYIQFAGFTAGRAQSAFDFFAGKIGYTNLRGSDQVVNQLSYTANFSNGFSVSASLEDAVSHRGPTPSVIAGGPVQNAPTPVLQGTRLPNFVVAGALNADWGKLQVSAGAQQLRTVLWTDPTQPALGSLVSTRKIGVAGQVGLQIKLDFIAPSDELWLQATLAKGALGYVSGSNLNLGNGFSTSTNYGVGLNRVSSGNGWHGGNDSDCVWTYNATCEPSVAFALTGALQHFWTPTISSTLTGSFYQVRYPRSATNPAIDALAAGLNSFGVGATNYKEALVTSGLRWNPVRGLEIGAEAIWQHGVTSRPIGLASDPVLLASGLPAFRSTANLLRGRARIIRAF